MSSAAILPQSTATDGRKLPSAEALEPAEKLFRFAVLTLTFLFPPLLCLMLAYVAEPDIWWHLSSGDWILRHHAFPRTDSFSYTTEGHPWQAYSWLFELLLAKLYAHFGLVGVVTYTTAMVLAITAALFHLIYSAQRNLLVALPLTAVSGFALLTLFSPRPWHFSIFFFALELSIVQKARRYGPSSSLFALPLLFAVWANLHIQFLDGLLLLALVALESLLFHAQSQKYPSVSRISPLRAAVLLALCIGATLINPYGWGIYAIAHDLAMQRGVLNSIEELRAMPFRALSNDVVLFLTMAATAILARSSRFRFFETILLLGAAVLSFRSQRDIWLVVITSAAILAEKRMSAEDEHSHPLSLATFLLALPCAALVLLGAARLIHLSNATLEPRLEAAMPVHAAAFVHDRHIEGPVFCDFIWGGYLIHSLALPVSIDGRAALHGDDQLDRSAHTWAGAPDWSTNPQLASAGVVVAPVSAALTQLLRSDTRFNKVYEDKLAAVFVPRSHSQPTAAALH